MSHLYAITIFTTDLKISPVWHMTGNHLQIAMYTNNSKVWADYHVVVYSTAKLGKLCQWSNKHSIRLNIWSLDLLHLL